MSLNRQKTKHVLLYASLRDCRWGPMMTILTEANWVVRNESTLSRHYVTINLPSSSGCIRI
jgi:hypothetical protein